MKIFNFENFLNLTINKVNRLFGDWLRPGILCDCTGLFSHNMNETNKISN